MSLIKKGLDISYIYFPHKYRYTCILYIPTLYLCHDLVPQFIALLYEQSHISLMEGVLTLEKILSSHILCIALGTTLSDKPCFKICKTTFCIFTYLRRTEMTLSEWWQITLESVKYISCSFSSHKAVKQTKAEWD